MIRIVIFFPLLLGNLFLLDSAIGPEQPTFLLVAAENVSLSSQFQVIHQSIFQGNSCYSSLGLSI